MSNHANIESLGDVPDTSEFSLEYVANSLERTRSFLEESRTSLAKGDYDGAYSWMKNAEQEIEELARASSTLIEGGDSDDRNRKDIFRQYAIRSLSIDAEYIRTLVSLWGSDLETNLANARITPSEISEMLSRFGPMVFGAESSEKLKRMVAWLEKDYVLSRLDRDLKRLEEDPKSRAKLEPAIRQWIGRLRQIAELTNYPDIYESNLDIVSWKIAE